MAKIHIFKVTTFLLLAILLFICIHKNIQEAQQTASASSLQPIGPSGTWNLVFSDEFDDSPGMSGIHNGLQTSKWNSGWYSGPTNPGIGDIHAVTNPVIQSLETEYYGPTSLKLFGDSALHLRLQKGVDNGGNFGGKNIESGMITTAGLLAFNPATVSVSNSNPDLRPYTINGPSILEIRARIPGPNNTAGSYWPAFWLTNAGNYGGTNPAGTAWPGGQNYSEEIDLTEWYSRGSLGSGGRFHLHSASEYGGMSSVPSALQNTDMSLVYHTYTYYFTSSSIQLWVDGVLVTGITPNAAQIAAQWKYPQYLMLAFQAYSGATYPTVDTGQPNDLMIDYVRVWQQCMANCVTPSPNPTNITPSTTPTKPTNTTLSLMLGLHGLGKGGDNANPNSTGNMSPKHTTRPAAVTFFDLQNTQAGKADGTITFDTQSGLFVGSLSLNTLLTGDYLLSVKSPGYLMKRPTQVIHISSGQSTQLPKISLVTADIDNNNQVDILDYNVLVFQPK